MKKQQTGFTLVEIAIVLVIIGLLLGGVLKGQELINSAKVKNLANDFRTIPLFIYGYQDKYKRLPGDDDGVTGTATGRFATKGTPATNGTRGNGIIEGKWDSATATDETVLFWQHARLAGLAAGSTDFSSIAAASLPTNAEGGRVGIQMTAPIKDLSGTYYICSIGINGKLAQQLDTTLDDGKPDNGTLRAQALSSTVITTDDTKGGAATYADGTSYVVCQAL